MGMFQVKVGVANPRSPEQRFEEPFWVDTGALYSFAPEDRLRAIGLCASPCFAPFAPLREE